MMTPQELIPALAQDIPVLVEDIVKTFQDYYRREPVVVRSPGRVNLLGEHTDYNSGFVLPAAIDKEIYLAVAANNTGSLRAYAFDLQEETVISLAPLTPSPRGWANYLVGVVAQFQLAGLPVPGFDLVFGGNIPMGAGLSSSAAVACGLAYALNHLFKFNQPRLALAKMAQQAEHQYAGVRCGIMDQFASLYGKTNHVIKLDCRSLAYQYYPCDMSGYRLVLCDTQVKHALASSAYNTRRQECEAGVILLQRHYPHVHSLRDVTLAMLEKHRADFPPQVYLRCSFVVKENARVEGGAADLAGGDLAAFGAKMFASHQGLQQEYEVSCPELDFLAHWAAQDEAVLGARMMGGGFGGCTINLVKQDRLENFAASINQTYERRFSRQLRVYMARLVAGTSLLCAPDAAADSRPPGKAPLSFKE
jgi:galactokinase